jgi:hypothetical protein
MFLAPIVQPYYYALLVLKLFRPPPPLYFLQVWSVEELTKFELFMPNLKGENFCVQFLFVDEFF